MARAETPNNRPIDAANRRLTLSRRPGTAAAVENSTSCSVIRTSVDDASTGGAAEEWLRCGLRSRASAVLAGAGPRIRHFIRLCAVCRRPVHPAIAARYGRHASAGTSSALPVLHRHRREHGCESPECRWQVGPFAISSGDERRWAGYRGLAGIHRRGVGPLSRRRLVVRLDAVRRGTPQRRALTGPSPPTSTIPARRSPGVNSTAAANALAEQLAGVGVARGDRVAVWHGDSAAIHVLFVAIERCGAVVVGIGARAGTREVAAILHSSRPKMLISDQQRSDAATQAAAAGRRIPVPVAGVGSRRRRSAPEHRRRSPRQWRSSPNSVPTTSS